jgi:hypothetical protein
MDARRSGGKAIIHLSEPEDPLLGGDRGLRRPDLLDQPAQHRNQPASGLRRSWRRGRLADGLPGPLLGLAPEMSEISIFVTHGVTPSACAGLPDPGAGSLIVHLPVA